MEIKIDKNLYVKVYGDYTLDDTFVQIGKTHLIGPNMRNQMNKCFVTGSNDFHLSNIKLRDKTN